MRSSASARIGNDQGNEQIATDCDDPQIMGGNMAKRTTHRSSKGTKLYAVRDKKGRFKDIQTYKRAHTADMKRKAKAEK